MSTETSTTHQEDSDCKIAFGEELRGHSDWVTAIAATADPLTVVSCSRDKSLIVWHLTEDEHGRHTGRAHSRLYGHEHFVQDLAVSRDGSHALTGSWDRTLRLWNLAERRSAQLFRRHTGDVTCVGFSADSRLIASGSRDGSLVLWNTKGVPTYTLVDSSDPAWVTCLAFSPKQNKNKNAEKSLIPSQNAENNAENSANNAETPKSNQNSSENSEKTAKNSAENLPGSTDLDFLVFATESGKVHKFNFRRWALELSLEGHEGPVTALAISPDASLCASGAKDGRVLLWELSTGARLRELQMGAAVLALRFNPGRYMLCGAGEDALRVWNLVLQKEDKMVCESRFEGAKCTAVEWTAGGKAILCGFRDGVIRVLSVMARGAAGPAMAESELSEGDEYNDSGEESGDEGEYK